MMSLRHGKPSGLYLDRVGSENRKEGDAEARQRQPLDGPNQVAPGQSHMLYKPTRLVLS
jgi:hypothetical protein